jgi:hypothetical protein
MAHLAEELLKGGIEGSTPDDCKDAGNKMLSGAFISHNADGYQKPNTFSGRS